ncbi:DUF881 domain-containing protein [Actinomycetaceae bacterium MB13-C1-2]|nr:DUF881 domain-containing protein [Actinomycetaceae bacterium MB13-C1-2]
MSDQWATQSTSGEGADESGKKPSVLGRSLGFGTGLLGSLAVGIISVTAGLLIGISVSNAQNHGYSDDRNLADIVREQQSRVFALEEQTDALTEQAQSLTQTSLPETSDASLLPISRLTVTGPGVEVSLSDAAKEFIPDEGASVNDLVVHQQDVDAVVNALWRGGAEAIAVQGVRLAADTPVRCVGNVILVGSRSYAPPYVISAIGDPSLLADSLDQDERVSDYRFYAAKYQMGWSVTPQESMVLPPATEIGLQGLASPLTR